MAHLTQNNVLGDQHIVTNNYHAKDPKRQLVRSIQKWLDAPNASIAFNRHADLQTADTGGWLLEHQDFTAWKNTPGSVMWLHGKVGAGKSVLSATVIDHIRSLSWEEDSCISFAYYFCDFAQAGEQNLANIALSLVSQLIDEAKGSVESIFALYKHCRNGQDTPQTMKLVEALHSILAASPGPTYIIIDGLDEVTDRRNLSRLLRQMIGDSPHMLHLLLTSRPEADIRALMDEIATVPHLDVSTQQIQSDIVRFIKHSLKESPRLRKLKPAVKDLVDRVLTEKAEGMFRWVSCQIEMLEKCLNEHQIKRALDDLPKTLQDTYDRILHNMDKQYLEPLLYIFHWMCYRSFNADVFRALHRTRDCFSTTHLKILTGIREDSNGCFRYSEEDVVEDIDDIFAMCSSLIKVDQRDSVVFAHFSVQEYFQRAACLAGTKLTTYLPITETVAYMTIAKCCIALIDYIVGDPECWLRSTPLSFSRYGMSSLAEHLCRAWAYYTSKLDLDDEIMDAHVTLLIGNGDDTEELVQSWWSMTAYSSPQPPPIHIAVIAGRLCIIRALCNALEVEDLNHADPMLGTPLYVAACNGNLNIVNVLIDAGASINAEEDHKRLPICGAAEHGNLDIVRLLIDTGVNVNAGGQPALILASRNGHLDVAMFLIERGADVNAISETDVSALVHASANGHLSIVSALLEAGANVNLPSFSHSSALHIASGRGHHAVVKILLKFGADVQLNTVEGPPLYKAAYEGHYDIVMTLLAAGATPDDSSFQTSASSGYINIVRELFKAGANIDSIGGRYGSALHASSYYGHLEVVEFLLSAGAEVNGFGGVYGSALQSAFARNHMKIVLALLKAGADPNSSEYSYGSNIQAAAAMGRVDIVKALIDAGVDINVCSQRHVSALLIALENSHIPVVMLLVDAGANVNEVDQEDNAAIQIASSRGYDQVVLALTRKGVDVNRNLGSLGSPIYAAATAGHIETTQILLNSGALIDADAHCALASFSHEGYSKILGQILASGADINATSSNGSTVLSNACANGPLSVVAAVLAAGADIDASAGSKGFPLYAAAAADRSEVVSLLVDSGVNVNQNDDKLGSAVQVAAAKGYFDVVQILVQAKANVNDTSERYGSALLIASLSGHERIVQLLLDNGADVSLSAERGGTALQAAAFENHLIVFKALLNAGSDVNAKAGWYGTALQCASNRGHLQIVQILLDAGADVNITGGYFGSSLAVASAHGHLEIVEALLHAGADIGISVGQYGSALEAAQTYGQTSIVAVLEGASSATPLRQSSK